MKLAVIINSTFVEALAKLKEQKLPLKAAMQVSAISKKAVEEMASFEALRIESAETLADKDESGKPVIVDGNYKIPKGKVTEFTLEVAEALNIEIDLGKIKTSDLGDISKISLSANDFETLSPIFDFGE